ncbi:hypothetical protein DID78_06935, partial [Candidatus Marinamargulisbacteria bacterium SCGC AG-343-D04]
LEIVKDPRKELSTKVGCLVGIKEDKTVYSVLKKIFFDETISRRSKIEVLEDVFQKEEESEGDRKRIIELLKDYLVVLQKISFSPEIKCDREGTERKINSLKVRNKEKKDFFEKLNAELQAQECLFEVRQALKMDRSVSVKDSRIRGPWKTLKEVLRKRTLLEDVRPELEAIVETELKPEVIKLENTMKVLMEKIQNQKIQFGYRDAEKSPDKKSRQGTKKEVFNRDSMLRSIRDRCRKLLDSKQGERPDIVVAALLLLKQRAYQKKEALRQQGENVEEVSNLIEDVEKLLQFHVVIQELSCVTCMIDGIDLRHREDALKKTIQLTAGDGSGSKDTEGVGTMMVLLHKMATDFYAQDQPFIFKGINNFRVKEDIRFTHNIGLEKDTEVFFEECSLASELNVLTERSIEDFCKEHIGGDTQQFISLVKDLKSFIPFVCSMDKVIDDKWKLGYSKSQKHWNKRRGSGELDGSLQSQSLGKKVAPYYEKLGLIPDQIYCPFFKTIMLQVAQTEMLQVAQTEF